MVADVYWLEPQTKLPNETPIDFANRVKKMIADKAGLINVDWNGYLKFVTFFFVGWFFFVVLPVLVFLFQNNGIFRLWEHCVVAKLRKKK